MTDKTIFTPDQGAVPPVVTQTPEGEAGQTPGTPPQPTVPPELSELVGEGKKYKTVEDAYKALPHAQQHISTLEADNARMKEELTKRKTAEELLQDMRNNEQPPAATTPGVEVNTNVVSEIVKQQLAESRLVEKQEANTTSVVNAFTQAYGEDKAEENYNKLALENGMSVSEINALAMKSPQVVLKLAGLTGKPKAPSTNFSSDVNTQANLGGDKQVATSRVVNYGKNSDIADGMRRAKEIVNQRLNS